jgi:hypothetical protein
MVQALREHPWRALPSSPLHHTGIAHEHTPRKLPAFQIRLHLRVDGVAGKIRCRTGKPSLAHEAIAAARELAERAAAHAERITADETPVANVTFETIDTALKNIDWRSARTLCVWKQNRNRSRCGKPTR